jgi:septal ring factor EnvC (AmiA/AmiB activator)
LSEKFDEFNNEIKKLTKLEDAVKKIKHENNTLKNQVSQREQQITQLEKNLTSTQVLIENIPAKSNENLKLIITQISNHLGIPSIVDKVTNITRLGRIIEEEQISNTKPPPILIQFFDVETKLLLLRKRKEKVMLFTRECDPDKNNFGL